MNAAVRGAFASDPLDGAVGSLCSYLFLFVFAVRRLIVFTFDMLGMPPSEYRVNNSSVEDNAKDPQGGIRCYKTFPPA